MFSSWARRELFWLLDRLNGSNIKKHLNNIRYHSQYGEIQGSQLDDLLSHAVSTVPFYNNISGKNSVQNFPVVSKESYKSKFDSFQSSLFINKRLHQMSTSGSTGTPFCVYQDLKKRARNIADLIYFNELGGQNLGDRFIFFRVWTDNNKKSKFEQFKQNLVPVDILHLDEVSLQNIRQLLKADKKINSALAYASTYEHLANYLSKCGDTSDMFHIKSLFTSSEVLDMSAKRRIVGTLGCSVYDRYSNQECGIIAQTKDLSEEFLVNIASYYVELLKIDSDEPAKMGELGRIVVTDLFNFAMPIIRYDTGDLAIKCVESNGGEIKLKSIQGRRVDVIYDTSGRELTPHTWSVYMWKFDKLKQYQFIQNGEKEYLLKVSGADGVYSDRDFDDTLRGILGSDADIKVEFVETIPVLRSGKFKKTICNYKKRV